MRSLALFSTLFVGAEGLALPHGCRAARKLSMSAVDVSDLGLTMDDLTKPLPEDAALQTSGSESVSRIAENRGCQWTETASALKATLTIDGLRGQPASALAVELTATTATVTAFGQAVWSCVLRGASEGSACNQPHPPRQ